jgi:DHA1 family bicyclomycin/chloramphenicol resistance-like MFS transporter
MGLPGIPAIEAQFADAAGRGPLTLSLFLMGFAISPLICGPLCDRFGRRRALLVGRVVFIAAAFSCAAAASFPILLGCRLVQGLAAGACAITPFAIVRDVFEGPVARNRLSQVAAVLGIAPMVAPILGGWVMTVADWRTIYAAQAAAGAIILAATVFGLPETLPSDRRRSLAPLQLLGTYRAVLADRAFRNFTMVYACGFACLFAFISSLPSVFMGVLGLSGQVFALLFAIISCGVMVGSIVSARLSSRHVPSHKLLCFGLAFMALGAVGTLALTGTVHAYTLVPLIWVTVFCFGLTGPSANHEAMHKLPHVAGAASGILRCA